MRNIELSELTRRDIDQQVTKVLRGLGNPPPPLSLADVRALLELDLKYYSSREHGVLAETVSRVKIGAHQIWKRPTLLIDAVRKLSLKALWVPDRKRILIDSDEPPLKHRWNEAHEISHSIIEWHKAFLHGDSERTLRPDCHYQIEGEANYAAGRLLFLQERFVTELADTAEVNFGVVKNLKKKFGNTLTATLWRTVEHFSSPALGLVTVHPRRTPDNFDWVNPVRYFIRSPAFSARFSKVTEMDAFRLLMTYCTYRTRGPLGEAEVLLSDDNGQLHEFYFETFNNTYDTLTLATHRRVRELAIAVQPPLTRQGRLS